MLNKKRRLVPNQPIANQYISTARELLRCIDYDLQYQKQEFRRVVRTSNHPLGLYFLREGNFLHYSFEGFGSLLGHQLALSHQGSPIASALINHNGDATLCTETKGLPSNFQLTISSTPVG